MGVSTAERWCLLRHLKADLPEPTSIGANDNTGLMLATRSNGRWVIWGRHSPTFSMGQRVPTWKWTERRLGIPLFRREKPQGYWPAWRHMRYIERISLLAGAWGKQRPLASACRRRGVMTGAIAIPQGENVRQDFWKPFCTGNQGGCRIIHDVIDEARETD